MMALWKQKLTPANNTADFQTKPQNFDKQDYGIVWYC